MKYRSALGKYRFQLFDGVRPIHGDAQHLRYGAQLLGEGVAYEPLEFVKRNLVHVGQGPHTFVARWLGG